MAITLEELQIKFTAQMGTLNTQLGGLKSQLAGLEGSTTKAQSAFGGLAKMFPMLGGAVLGAKLLSVGKEALQMANDAVESESLFKVSMGGMEQSARDWSESLSASLGLNAYELRKNVSMLNVMFGSMGLGEQEAYNMATGMTQLANDMASFYNLSTEEAFDKLRAGITGETEPLKRLGILVDDNTIKQYAMKKGISATGKEMTQQQKLQARYGAIMEQTGKAQGDLARTMDSPTNQLRKLNAQFDMAKIALGQALQPALMAVLPVMSSFATGLARVLSGSGVTTRNPFSDVVISLADATATVTGGVKSLTQETVDKVNALKTDVETALNEYAAAASATKTAYINITMQPDTTVYERVQKTLRELDQYVGREAAKGIQQDVKVWMDAAMQDGKVDPAEVEEIRAKLKARIQGLLNAAKEKKDAALANIKTQVELGVDKGGISQADADAQAAAAVEEYNKAVGVIEDVGIEVSAELGIASWTMPSLSKDDREAMRKSMQTTMDSEMAVALKAQAIVGPLFSGTGNVEGVVNTVYANAIELLKAKQGEISALMNNTIDADWDWSKINQLRQEMADIISYITTGITPKGNFQKALFDLQNLSPESLINFANAYTNTIKTLKGAEQEKLNMQENLLFSLNASGDMLGLKDALESMGYGAFEEAIASIREQKKNADQKIEEGFLAEAVKNLAPQLAKLFADENLDYGSALSMADALSNLMGSINVDNLSEAGKAQYEALKTMWDQMQKILVWTQNKDVLPKPDFSGGKPKKSVIPLTDGPSDFAIKGGLLELDNPKITMNNPIFRVPEYSDTGGGSFSASVIIDPTNVEIYMDAQKVARAVIKYLPKVAAQTGTALSGSGGGGSWMREKW